MAYVTNTEMAVELGLGTLAADSEPITTTGMTSLIDTVEGLVDGMIIGRTGNTLAVANTASAKAVKSGIRALTKKYYLSQQATRAGAQSRGTSEGSAAWGAGMQWEPELSMLIMLAGSGGSHYVTKSSVDEANLSGG